MTVKQKEKIKCMTGRGRARKKEKKWIREREIVRDVGREGEGLRKKHKERARE